MVSTFLTKENTIKDNVLSVEVTQAKKKKKVNFRTVRMGIKGMQISDNSSNKKWNNNFEVYLNPERIKAGITVTRVKSVRKKDLRILPSNAIRIIKNKIKFKKGMAIPKTSRFGKYI
jgi:hypothetical protein